MLGVAHSLGLCGPLYGLWLSLQRNEESIGGVLNLISVLTTSLWELHWKWMVEG